MGTTDARTAEAGTARAPGPSASKPDAKKSASIFDLIGSLNLSPLAVRERPQLVFAGVVLCFLLSGFAALIYQTAWLRLFSVYFGTSEYAVATVLAAYMAGLAIGAHIGGRLLHRITRPVLVYGFLEGLIALTALCVPLFMLGAGALYGLVAGGQPAPPGAGGLIQPLFYLVASILILAAPTICMGATLPILMRHVIRADNQVGMRSGLLYAVNTLGAVLGALATAFVLLPAFGLAGAIWIGIGVNFLIFLAAVFVSRVAGVVEPDAPAPATSNPATLQGAAPAPRAPFFPKTGRERWILPVMMISGAIAFVYEVLWTRLLGHVMGGGVDAFAIMLAAFLSGIAIGGAAGGALAANRTRAAWIFVGAQIAVAITSAAIYYWIEDLVPSVRSQNAHAMMAIFVMLPSTIFIGATFPLAVRILSNDEHDASEKAARIYSWNTGGAIIGAVAAAFLIIPALGFKGAIVFAVCANLALALAVAGAVVPKPMIWATAGLAIVTALTAALWRPARPESVIANTVFEMAPLDDPQEEFYRVGRSASVLALSTFGKVQYRSNGLPEANTFRKGAAPSILNQQWMGAAPPLFRPLAEEMMVIGYGGGAALEAVPSTIKQIDVIELEKSVIDANKETRTLRLVDPLADERVNIVLNDARNALRLTNKKYGVIVSQPSHPWTAGASHLFTREFMALAKSRLDDDGIFLQWMNAEFVDEKLLRDLIFTLLSEFEYATVIQPSPLALHIYASDAPIEFLPSTAPMIEAEAEMYGRIGVNSGLDLLAAMVLDDEGAKAFAEGGALITDNNNRMATHSRQYADGLTFDALTKLLSEHDPLARQGEMAVNRLHPDQALYLMAAVSRLGMAVRAAAIAEQFEQPPMQALAKSVIAKQIGRPAEAAAFARTALEDTPEYDAAQYLALFPIIESSERGYPDLETARIGDGAEEPLKTILKLNEHARADEWAEVLNADEMLARVSPMETYAPLALRLRAHARLALLEPTEEQMAEAMQFIERAIMLESTPQKWRLRSAIAERQGDAARILHSYWSLHFFLNHAANAALEDGASAAHFQKPIDDALAAIARVSAPEEADRKAYLEGLFQNLRERVTAA